MPIYAAFRTWAVALGIWSGGSEGDVAEGAHLRQPATAAVSLNLGAGTPGDFGMYIFAMSWKAEWCYHKSYPGCEEPEDFEEENLTIHGLWPDYGDGTYPTQCTDEPFDREAAASAVGEAGLERYWPNVQAAPSDKAYPRFWEHEWTKHGTCTGLTQEQYFSATVGLLLSVGTPDAIIANVGGEVLRANLEEAFGGPGMAVLDCKGKRYLSQVYLCLTADPETHLPAGQIACPAAVVQHDDTCTADTVEIASF